MPSRTFASLAARVQPHVPGCPNATIRTYIKDAAILACERTLAWRYEVPLFDLLPGVHDYAFARPEGADVHTIFAAIVNNQPLEKLNLDRALIKHPEWADLYSGETAETLWSETPSGSFNSNAYNDSLFDEGSEFVLPDSIVADAGSPCTIVMISPQNYIVLPLPDGETYTMRMFLALKPTRDATTMDRDVMNDMEDLIFHKTVETLALIPNVSWTNPQLAQIHAAKAKFNIFENRARANLGHVRGSMSVTLRNWV